MIEPTSSFQSFRIALALDLTCEAKNSLARRKRFGYRPVDNLCPHVRHSPRWHACVFGSHCGYAGAPYCAVSVAIQHPYPHISDFQFLPSTIAGEACRGPSGQRSHQRWHRRFSVVAVIGDTGHSRWCHPMFQRLLSRWVNALGQRKSVWAMIRTMRPRSESPKTDTIGLRRNT
jgi:hypothetical protein